MKIKGYNNLVVCLYILNDQLINESEDNVIKVWNMNGNCKIILKEHSLCKLFLLTGEKCILFVIVNKYFVFVFKNTGSGGNPFKIFFNIQIIC